MARAGQLREKTVREDPPETMLNPDQQALALVDSSGNRLKHDELGFHDGSLQYCWVNKANQQQFIRYQARGYKPCRYGGNHAKPQFQFFQEAEETEDNAVIERGEMVLMGRPVEQARIEQAYAKRTNLERLKQMGKVGDDLKRRARRGGMHVAQGSFDD